jgi:hypothetical protein
MMRASPKGEAHHYQQAKFSRYAAAIHVRWRMINPNDTCSFIWIENDGPLIRKTNYWDSDLAKHGKFYVTANAGAIRLLCPPNMKHYLSEMKTGRKIILSIGLYCNVNRNMLEILFDDYSDTPFCLMMDLDALDRMPLASEYDKEREFSVWVQGVDGKPKRRLLRKCWLRQVKELPCLQPL